MKTVENNLLIKGFIGITNIKLNINWGS